MKRKYPEFFEKLSKIYGNHEAQAIIQLCAETLGTITPQTEQRLLQCEPVQYITGTAHFAGLDYTVNPATLIPRGETEELTRYVAQTLGKDFSGTIVDIGTGSGIIAITLALQLPKAKISAIDICPKALETAQKNAHKHGANIEFTLCDILQNTTPLPYDITVSNPPYVTESQKLQMHPNVLDWEPHTALFVSDQDPLIFYRKIAEQSQTVFFEINEEYPLQTTQMLEKLGYHNVKTLKDIHNKHRICHASRK